MLEFKLPEMNFEDRVVSIREARSFIQQEIYMSPTEWDMLESVKISLNKFGFNTSTNRLNKSIYFEDEFKFGFNGSIFVSGETYKLSCTDYMEFKFTVEDDINRIVYRNLYQPLMEAKEGLAQGLTMALTERLYGGKIAKYHIIKDYTPGTDISILKDLVTINNTDSKFTASLRLESLGDYNFKTLIKCYQWVIATVSIINN